MRGGQREREGREERTKEGSSGEERLVASHTCWD